MSKVFLILGLLSVLGSIIGYYTGQGWGVFLTLGCSGAMLIIVGIAGENLGDNP